MSEASATAQRDQAVVSEYTIRSLGADTWDAFAGALPNGTTEFGAAAGVPGSTASPTCGFAKAQTVGTMPCRTGHARRRGGQ